MAPRAPPIAPTATPNAATVPMSIFLDSGALAVLSALAVVFAAAASWSLAAASAAAARLATCSSIMRMNFLYGDKNA